MNADALRRKLLAARSHKISTSTLARLAKTAGIALRTGISGLTGPGSGILAGMSPAAVERMVTSFGELKGISMKMGQILSYIDDAIPAELQELLANLQRYSQPTEWVEVERTICEDLGPNADELLARMDREPVACASVGQVYRVRWGDGSALAVKVRHPSIDLAMEADFKATFPATVMARVVAPGVDVEQFIVEARDGFLSECDYVLEASNQKRFAGLFAGHSRLVVPRTFDKYCGARVLTSEWCDGLSLEEYLATKPALAERNAVAEALYEFYVGTLYRHGVFNADPHPGNLLFREDGTIVVLDYGCVRTFEESMVASLKGLSLAVQQDEREAICHALVQLGAKRPDSDEAFEVTRDLLRSFYEPLLYPAAQTIQARVTLGLKDAAAVKIKIMKMHLPGNLLFLFRIRFGLYALLRRIGAELKWSELEARMLLEQPPRCRT